MKKILLLCMLFSTVVLAQNNLGQLAYQYFQQGEYSKAIEIYKELNQKNVSASYFNPYLNCLIQIEDYKSAEKLVSKIIRKYGPGLRGLTFYPDTSRGGQPLEAVPWAEAKAKRGVVYEDNSEEQCLSGVCSI